MQTHKKTSWVGGGEANTDPLGDGGLVGARDLIANHCVRQHLNADLCLGRRGRARESRKNVKNHEMQKIMQQTL